MAINDISLTSGMRTNLVSLQTTTELLNRTQDRLSSGKKVNTALDNALNFFTAKALNTRADELAGYKDGMSEAVQTIKAANAGISAIEGLIGQAKAVAATAKAGGTAGTGAVSNITVDLVGITAGQTINVGGTDFTAVAEDGHLQKTINFSAVTGGSSVTLNGVTYTASQGSVSKTLDLANIAAGDSIVIDTVTYTASAGSLQSTLNLSSIAAGDNITMGSTQYAALAVQQTVDIAGMAQGDTITIGSTTYMATSGATETPAVAGRAYFDISGGADADTDAFLAALTTNGISSSTTTEQSHVLLTTTASSLANTASGAGTITNNSTTDKQFLVDGDAARDAASFLAKIQTYSPTFSSTLGGSTGQVVLTYDTSLGTVAEWGGATLSTANVNNVVTSSSATAKAFFVMGTDATDAGSFLTLANTVYGSTIGAAGSGGTIVLTYSVSAGTVNETGGATITTTYDNTVVTSSSDTQKYFFVNGTASADAGRFLTLANAVNVATFASGMGTQASGASDIVLNHDASLLTLTGASGATTSESTLALADDEFYIGVGSTTLGVTNNMSATNLAAKLNISSGGEYVASVSANRINITAGTANLTDAGTPLVLTLADTVSSAATTATAGFTIEYNKSTVERSTYAAQFNTIMAQLDLLAFDSSYKGINFLEAGSSLDVIFGTLSTDKITLEGFDASAKGLLAKSDITFEDSAQNTWATNDDVNTDIAALARATATLKAQASSMSSGLSIINTRQDFVKAMVNTVTQGADNLTLADMNEEGANMLMLQTRQSLSTTALSMSAQAAQSVLRLFA